MIGGRIPAETNSADVFTAPVARGIERRFPKPGGAESPAVTLAALRLQKERLLHRYLIEVDRVGRRLSQSLRFVTISAELERSLAALTCRRREPLPFSHSLYQTSRPAGGAPRSILVVDAARSVNGF